MNFIKIISAIAVDKNDLVWGERHDLSIKKNPKLGDLPEFLTDISFKREILTLEDESVYQVFHLNESDYHDIFRLFSITEDFNLNELYRTLKLNGKDSDYVIAFKLNREH